MMDVVVHRIRREEYDRIVATGVFEGQRLELLHGLIVEMSPHDPAHDSPVQLLTRLLVRALGDRAEVRPQLAFVAADESEPEPDIAVVPPGAYATAHPDEAMLLIEVANASLRADRLVKAPLYARSNVREYWIVDVKGRAIEVYRGAADGVWSSMTRYGLEDTVAVQSFPDVRMRVADVLR